MVSEGKATAMTDPARLGSIGLGWWGGVLAETAAKSGHAEIVSCFARTESSRNAFAEQHGCRTAASVEELLDDDDVEGVLVATPHSTHEKVITRAAEAGKHVFVEKPLTLTVAEGRRAIDAAKRAGVALQVGHHRRRQAATRELRHLTDTGELGILHLLEANLSSANNLKPRQGWRNDPEECPLGGMTGLGVHMADNLQYLAGPVRQVSVFSRRLLGRGNLDDVTTFILEFTSGALGYLGTAMVVPKICTTAAFGTEGSAWSEEEGQRLFRQSIDEKARNEHPVEPIDAITDELIEFAGAVRGERTPETDGETSLEVVAILEAGVRSHQEGRPVELSEVR